MVYTVNLPWLQYSTGKCQERQTRANSWLSTTAVILHWTALPALLLPVALLLLPLLPVALLGLLTVPLLLLAEARLLRLGLLGWRVILLLLGLAVAALVIATLRRRWLAIRIGGLVVGCLARLVVASTIAALLLLLPLLLPLLAVATLIVPLLST